MAHTNFLRVSHGFQWYFTVLLKITTKIHIFTLIIRFGIIAVTVIPAVILIIIFTIYAVTVISSWEVKIWTDTIILFLNVALRAASILKNHVFWYLKYYFIWVDLSTKSMLERLVSKNAVECTGQRLK